MTAAATAANLDRNFCYMHRKRDPEFAAAWDEAIEAGTDILEDVAAQRAVRSSDVLLMFLLNGRRPDKFNARQKLDLSNSDGSLGNFVNAMRRLDSLPRERVPLLIEGEAVRRGG